jgi:pimeloyl-ACP methyl ester carboxylesterase
MFKHLVATAALLGCLLTFPLAASQVPPSTTFDATGILFHDLELRPGVTADIHVTVMGDLEAKDCLLILHGGPFTAESWRPFAEALGSDHCVLGLDMPARGQSTVPVGIVFGDLLLDDYVNVVLRVLDRLEGELHIRPETIGGHSLGGIVLQMVQQRLVEEGTSLKQRYHIREAILVAPDFPQDVPWTFGDNGGAASIAPFIVEDPVLGSVLRIEAAAWPGFFFTNKEGNLIPTAPTPAEIAAAGWVAPGEPEQALNQLLGAGSFSGRPHVDAGIFAKGTRLRVIAFEGDGFILSSETPALYAYLTGDETFACSVGVPGIDTVHATFISDPEILVAALEASDRCRYGKPR